ncbi:hypothetical protein OZX57_01975 [Bifidobacterium sp. ESL0682]|uniref:hypothetical protein n=1 Tax=Bifidobacterium sp. ESL0682 TaxID=2983212 RepID=UPI0023F824CA|nr:hypothetical protein [Bifidobacterium sp. ESL0682]WEV42276.1 hypothetical protein OZX57_01975 [Bifidobacterium sp. ESL0682]
MSNALPQRFRGNMSDSAKQPAAGIASDSVDSVNQTASAFNASTNSASPTSSVSTNTAGSWANTPPARPSP